MQAAKPLMIHHKTPLLYLCNKNGFARCKCWATRHVFQKQCFLLQTISKLTVILIFLLQSLLELLYCWAKF